MRKEVQENRVHEAGRQMRCHAHACSVSERKLMGVLVRVTKPPFRVEFPWSVEGVGVCGAKETDVSSPVMINDKSF